MINNAYRFELLVLFGGDGTFNEALNGLMRNLYRPKVLYIPVGTVNDLGKYLYIPTKYTDAFSLLNNEPTSMDVCKVNEKYFSYVLGCGKFTNVSYGSNLSKWKKIFGRLYYYLRGLNDLFSRKSITMSINEENAKKVSLILLLNIWRVGNFKIRKKNNKLNDGYINMVFFTNTIFFGIFSIFVFLVFGIALKGLTEIKKVSSFTIKIKDSVLFNSDGEECYRTNYIKVEVVKEALLIYVPQKAKEKFF